MVCQSQLEKCKRKPVSGQLIIDCSWYFMVVLRCYPYLQTSSKVSPTGGMIDTNNPFQWLYLSIFRTPALLWIHMNALQIIAHKTSRGQNIANIKHHMKGECSYLLQERLEHSYYTGVEPILMNDTSLESPCHVGLHCIFCFSRWSP